MLENLVGFLVGGLALGLPVWFGFQDRIAAPRLRWVREGDPPPVWGTMVVFIGVALAVLVALAAPEAGLGPTH